jgi:hypothetical protein
MKRVYGDEKRYGMSSGIAYIEYSNGRSDQYFIPSYNAADHRRDSLDQITNVDIFLDQGVKYYFIINGQRKTGDYRVSSSFYKTLEDLLN